MPSPAMVFDSVAFKNVVSNGLVQDKLGRKMSKRLGKYRGAFQTIAQYGADPPVVRFFQCTALGQS